MRSDVFPAFEASTSGYLDVGGGHQLFYEESGNPRGLPVVVLHGGPGSCVSPALRRFFNPRVYRICMFDQRGAGRSYPACGLEQNTTQDLVADIERLRQHLQIDRWVVFGGSWGATLALAYAQAHPASCLSLILRGIFLGTWSEIEWFLGPMRLFTRPAWKNLRAHLPEDMEDQPQAVLDAMQAGLQDPGRKVELAQAWMAYENAASALQARKEHVPHALALSLATLEVHYFQHGCFLEPDQLVREAGKLSEVPGVVVQGAQDLVCPPNAAQRLCEAWPAAQLRLIEPGGHAAMEEQVRRALVRATQEVARVHAPI